MGQVLHGCATTTEAIRRAIQNSQESLRGLAKRYGINQKTVAKWKRRETVADLPTGPKKAKSTLLSIEEEAIIIAFRRLTLLSLDDCLYALQPTIPHLTRSSLHRCLKRHGISRLPEIEGSRPSKKRFKAYPIGYFHIDIAEVQTAEGKLYLYVAIDRTSKFAFVQLVRKTGRTSAAAFLEALIAAVPYKIHTVLTDNGTQFTFPPRYADGPTARYATHMFDLRCQENGIEHRLTKIKFFAANCAMLTRRTGDRAAKSGTRGESPAAQPLSSFLLCGACARLWSPWIPASHEPRIGCLGLLDPAPLLLAMALEVIGVGGPFLSAGSPVSRFELEITQLPGMQGRTRPQIALALAQQMPEQNRELARRCNRRNVLPASGADPQEEGPQGTRCSRCHPRCLDEHAASVAATLLGYPPVIGRPRTGLPYTGVEAKIAD